eukprot:1059514-Alexandrium_andersonii.AAC.1
MSEALRLSPNSGEARFHMASLMEREGDLEAANSAQRAGPSRLLLFMGRNTHRVTEPSCQR